LSKTHKNYVFERFLRPLCILSPERIILKTHTPFTRSSKHQSNVFKQWWIQGGGCPYWLDAYQKWRTLCTKMHNFCL